MRFTCYPNLMFLASPWLKIFNLANLLTLSSSKLIVIVLTFGKSKVTLIVHLYKLWAGHIYSTEFGQDIGPRKTTRHRIWPNSFSMIQWAVTKNWISQLINRLQGFNLLLLSITHFADLCGKIKYVWWEWRQKVWHNWEISFKWLLSWQY